MSHEAVIAEIIAAEITTARCEIERLFDRRMLEFERFVERRMAELAERTSAAPRSFDLHLDGEGTFFQGEAEVGSVKALIAGLLRTHGLLPKDGDE